jgi:G3E family GTPase
MNQDIRIPSEKIPVTVLTGFLGAGKTTLLNHILKEKHGRKIAVIVNEYGEVGIDQELVIGAEEEIIEMNNGCICCTVRGDLTKILKGLILSKQGLTAKKFDFEWVIIETTGLADPAPVAQTFFVDEAVSLFYNLDAIVTLVDAKHADQHLNEGHEALEQVAFSDVLLLNKTDLVNTKELEALKNRLQGINPSAKIYPTKMSEVNLDKILGIDAFSLDKKLEIEPDFLKDHHHHHDQSISSIVITEDRPLDVYKVDRWFGKWLDQHAVDTFRYKGILNIKESKKQIIFQGIHMMFGMTEGKNWKENETRKTQIVVIGRNLDKKFFEDGIKDCVSL